MPPIENIGENIDKGADGVETVVKTADKYTLAFVLVLSWTFFFAYAYYANKGCDKRTEYREKMYQDERTAHALDNNANRRDQDSLKHRIEYLDSVNAELIAGKYKSVLDLLHVQMADGKIKITQ